MLIEDLCFYIYEIDNSVKKHCWFTKKNKREIQRILLFHTQKNSSLNTRLNDIFKHFFYKKKYHKI